MTRVGRVAEALAALDDGLAWVILDLMLPDGDGANVLRAVRSGRLPARVAVTTGVGDPDRLTIVRALRPDALLRKPIDLAQLLRDLLSDPGPADPG